MDFLDGIRRKRRDLKNWHRISRLRRRGAKIGKGCLIYSAQFSTEPYTEPYLIEIGDGVAIAAGVVFITHVGIAWLLRRTNPGLQAFGRIRVGPNSPIGTNAIILPGTEIGANCIIQAGWTCSMPHPASGEDALKRICGIERDSRYVLLSLGT